MIILGFDIGLVILLVLSLSLVHLPRRQKGLSLTNDKLDLGTTRLGKPVLRDDLKTS
jgi:hypothetical protein